MPARASVQVLGIKEALKELNDFDKQYRRQVTKDIQGAGEQIISEARSMVAHFDNSKQNGAPLSGMVRGNLIKGRETSWRTDAVQKGFKVKVGVRASKERYVNFNRTTDGVITHQEQVVFGSKPYQLMVIQQANAAGAIYDHAGRNTNSMFVSNLNAEVGPQPRAIDKAVENNRGAVEQKVLEIVDAVSARLNRKLAVTHGN
jgi:mRNA-degrading endonuclease RelE of RelBE toxin-antitoxin system